MHQTLHFEPLFDATITGAAGDDRLDGGDLNELIQGLGGDDLIQGLGGDDSLVGGAGDDTLLGGSGRDTLDGGGGHNVLSGGSGNDVFIVRDLATTQVDGGSGYDTADLTHLDAGLWWSLDDQIDQTSLIGIENLIGTHFRDQLTGDFGRNELSGKGGDDFLQASDNGYPINPGEAGDKLTGGSGRDSLIGYSGDDTLKGGAGDDYLQGDGYSEADDRYSVSADLVTGGGGDDHIVMAGGDTVTGGSGADIFSFAYQGGPPGTNLITDLTGEDQIDLGYIDADTTTSGDQAFTLVASLDGHAGEAALVYDAGPDETALELDTDGDGSADITIRLSGDHTDFTNFVL